MTDLMTTDELARLAELGTALRDSGYFGDATTVAQAAVKVLAGRELGLGPVESMRAIHIVSGKVELSADLLAARVKLHPRYDYRIVTLNDAGCVIEFFQDGESLGLSEFMDADRVRAKLTTSTWTQYPRNMMFARAMSNGVAWFCPDVASGARLYVDGELDPDNERAPKVVETHSSTEATGLGDALPSPVAERPGAEADGGPPAPGQSSDAGGDPGEAAGGEASSSRGVAPAPLAVSEPHEHVPGKKLASGSYLCSFEFADGLVCGFRFKPKVTVHTAPITPDEERKDIA